MNQSKKPSQNHVPPATKPGNKVGAKSGSYVQKGAARYDRHDFYFRKARESGFVARSVFKLEQIDQSCKLFRPNMAVLDLGCAPGSWLQYVEPRTRGPAAIVVGIDLEPVGLALGGHVHLIQGDAFEVGPEVLCAPLVNAVAAGIRKSVRFDVVISDMAPHTTGIRSVDQIRSLQLCERARDVAVATLKRGGSFCCKIFSSNEVGPYVKSCQKHFDSVRIVRPEATRDGSTEVYVVALGFIPTLPVAESTPEMVSAATPAVSVVDPPSSNGD